MKGFIPKLEEKLKQVPSSLKKQATLIVPPIVTITSLGVVGLLYHFSTQNPEYKNNSEVVRGADRFEGNVHNGAIDNVIRDIQKSNKWLYYSNDTIIPNTPYYKSGSGGFYLPLEITRDNISKEVILLRQYLLERDSDGRVSQSYRQSYDIYNPVGHKLGRWEQDRNDNTKWSYSFQDRDGRTKVSKYRIHFADNVSINKMHTDTINGSNIVRDLEDKLVYGVSEMGEFTKEVIPYSGDIVPDNVFKVYGDGKFFITDRQEINSNTGAIESESGNFIAINPWIRERNDRCVVEVERKGDKLHQKTQEEDTYKSPSWVYRKYVPAELRVEQK